MLHDDLTLEEIHEEAAEECREVCAVVSLIEAMRKGSGYTEKRCVQSAIGLYWSTSESSQGVRELAEGIGHIFFELGQQYERKRVMTERSREISA
ncbi:MAG: hypothetical protein JWN64_585 [Parcubacteria group bacterium]|nr:hypothetical protein [Parcubacteria group bacterium]